MSSGAHNRQICDASKTGPWFGAVFFAKTKLRNADDLKRIWNSAVKKANTGKHKNPAKFPDCIAILDGPLFIIDKRKIGEGKLSVKAYDCGKAAPAAFLNDLSASLPLSGRDNTRRGEWFYMLTKLAKKVIYSETYECIS